MNKRNQIILAIRSILICLSFIINNAKLKHRHSKIMDNNGFDRNGVYMEIERIDLTSLLQKITSCEDIDDVKHNGIIKSSLFKDLSCKMDIHHSSIARQIYWASFLGYILCGWNYRNNLVVEESCLKIKRNNILVFHPFMEIFEDICILIKGERLNQSLLSLLGRQILEQICLIKKCDIENVTDQALVLASISSYNKHLSSTKITSEEQNWGNPGLWKVFKYQVSISDEVGKTKEWYKYKYQFFSGDIHAFSTIDRIVAGLPVDIKYVEIYLQFICEAIFDAIVVVLNYDNATTLSVSDFYHFKDSILESFSSRIKDS